jgi:membrane protein
VPKPNTVSSTIGSGWQVVVDLVAKLRRDHSSILAAGIAFYALMSVIPGLSVLISLYGLFADPHAVETNLTQLRGVLPADAVSLISGWLDALLTQSHATFSLGLLISLAVSLWVARNAAGAMMTALGIAYEVEDQRNVVEYNVVALGLTIVLVLLGLASLMLAALVPVVASLSSVPPELKRMVSLLRWPLLLVVMSAALGVTYRYGPNRADARRQWATPGALFATLLWLLGSLVLSYYVRDFGTFDRTYGSLGAIVVLLSWFWLGSYAVVTGAALNRLLEQRATAAGSADRK